MTKAEQEGEPAVRPERTADLLSALPDRVSISSGLEIRKVNQTDTERFFEIAEQNPDIKSNVAWAARVDDLADVMPSLQQYPSNENLDGRFAIVSEGRVVGYIGIHPGNQDGEFGIGYFLDAASRGKGIVTAALTAAIEQTRVHLDARRIYCQVKLDNEASAAVPQRLGFRPAEIVMGVDFPVEQRRWRLELNGSGLGRR